jgi:hypothetical protein
MTKKKLIATLSVIVLVAVVGMALAGTALAQSSTPQGTTPQGQGTPETPKLGFWGRGFGFGGGESTAMFDKVAELLGITPTQLFDELHSGKTIEQVVTAHGKTLQDLQNTLQAERTQSMKDAIAQAVTDGKITKEQGDWLLQGLDKGYLNNGFGFGRGGRGMHGMMGEMKGMRGMRGFGNGQNAPTTPNTTAPGTSS